MNKIIFLLLITINYSNTVEITPNNLSKTFVKVSYKVTNKSPNYIYKLLFSYFDETKNRDELDQNDLNYLSESGSNVIELLQTIIHEVDTKDIFQKIYIKSNIFQSDRIKYIMKLELKRAELFGNKKEYQNILLKFVKKTKSGYRIYYYFNGLYDLFVEEAVHNKIFLKIMEDNYSYISSKGDGFGFPVYPPIAKFLIDNNGVSNETIKKSLQSKNKVIHLWGIKKVGTLKLQPLYKDVLKLYNERIFLELRSSPEYFYFHYYFDDYLPYKIDNQLGKIEDNTPIRNGF